VSGIGASAAHCVSLARALATALGKPCTEEEINAAGFEGEKGYHGTPSGIDNTAATYGGLLRFQRTDAAPIFAPQALPLPCRIVYASTGITASTTKVVGDVAAKKEADPAWYAALEQRYLAEVLPRADAALQAGDWPQLGATADVNHGLLQELSVSCPELDRLVAAAKAAGALGAKLAGTGRGGLMFAVCGDDEALQAKVFEALTQVGFGDVWKTSFA
jgi:mevalonate kinase